MPHEGGAGVSLRSPKPRVWRNFRARVSPGRAALRFDGDTGETRTGCESTYAGCCSFCGVLARRIRPGRGACLPKPFVSSIILPAYFREKRRPSDRVGFGWEYSCFPSYVAFSCSCDAKCPGVGRVCGWEATVAVSSRGSRWLMRSPDSITSCSKGREQRTASDAACEVCGRGSGRGREGRRGSAGFIVSEGSSVNTPKIVGEAPSAA